MCGNHWHCAHPPYCTKHHLAIRVLRVSFGSSLTLTLELLLAADILRTAVASTWEDIGKLAAIRTVLNYFLEKELRTIEHEVDAATAKNME